MVVVAVVVAVVVVVVVAAVVGGGTGNLEIEHQVFPFFGTPLPWPDRRCALVWFGLCCSMRVRVTSQGEGQG